MTEVCSTETSCLTMAQNARSPVSGALFFLLEGSTGMKLLPTAPTIAAALLAAFAASGCTPQETADAKNMAEWVSKVATQVEKTASQVGKQECPEGQVCSKSSSEDAIIPMREIQEAAVMVKNAATLLASIAGEVEKIPGPFKERVPQVMPAPSVSGSPNAPAVATQVFPAPATGGVPVVEAPKTAATTATAPVFVAPGTAPLQAPVGGDVHAALRAAAQSGDAAAVQRALNAGAAIDRGDERHGNTPLILAANHGHTDIVRLLIRSGANLNRSNDNGANALIAAVMSGHQAAAQLLIEQGANLNATDKNGRTALALAEQSGQGAIAAMLRAAGARG